MALTNKDKEALLKIGKLIESERGNKKLSKYALSKNANIKRSNYDGIGEGDKNYTIVNFLKICSSLDINVFMQVGKEKAVCVNENLTNF